jgi:hypothetical protein
LQHPRKGCTPRVRMTYGNLGIFSNRKADGSDGANPSSGPLARMPRRPSTDWRTELRGVTLCMLQRGDQGVVSRLGRCRRSQRRSGGSERSLPGEYDGGAAKPIGFPERARRTPLPAGTQG